MITIDRQDYSPTKEHHFSDCAKCAFEYDQEKCDVATSIMPCQNHNIIWIKIEQKNKDELAELKQIKSMLPTALFSGSKDWTTGSTVERLEWLLSMYGSVKADRDLILRNSC